MRGKHLLQLGGLIRCRVRIVGAEQAEQRTGQVGREPDDRLSLQRRPFGWLGDHECAVTVHRGVELDAASGQEGLAATGAVADDADLSIG